MTILESDGSDDDICAGVTAASVALAEAGVQMRGLVVGCSAVSSVRTIAGFATRPKLTCSTLSDSQAFPPETTTPLLDPTLDEVKQSTSFASIACLPALGTVTHVSVRGVIPTAVFDQVSGPLTSCSTLNITCAYFVSVPQALKQCLDSCGAVHAVAKAALLEGAGEE